MVTRDFDQFAILAVVRHGRKVAGAPIITNVSFNLCGVAILRTPVDVGRPFIRSGIDALKMGNFLVEK